MGNALVAPIRRKKSIRTFYGDAQILFFASSGASYPTSTHGIRPRDFEELMLGNFSGVERTIGIGS